MNEADRLRTQGYDLNSITKENVISAINKIDQKGIPARAHSSTYDLVYNGKTYPPKLVLSFAYEDATGERLSRNKFQGGKNTACFDKLNNLGFKIQLKQEKPIQSFYPIVQKFIEQADEENSLKVNDYPKEYEGLKVTVSFGKGKYAKIPLITFLYQGQTASNGIYPVLLYYKEQNILILAYSVSETIRPRVKWQGIPDSQKIKYYFASKNWSAPERYGDSYVYKVYDLEIKLKAEEIDKDLKDIIAIYKKAMDDYDKSTGERIIETKRPFDITQVSDIGQTKLLFNTDLLYRYAISLLTKPFVILSGLSGSGKTRLALSFAKWLTKDSSQVKIVSVGSDWNNREYLLGYPDALQPGRYIKPENGVLDFIIEANKHPERPYFLILDEMNLSYVERYFADFLSTMESDAVINLHPTTEEWDGVPSSITLPKNLYITGTINVDETTYMFSSKVLDRANVIEFRISEEEMEEYLAKCEPVEPNAADYKGAAMEKDFVVKSQDSEFEKNPHLNSILLEFFKHLKAAGAEFGYRTASEMFRFIANAQKLETGWDENKLIDIVVMQKLLPKLHGSRKKLQPILKAIWELCIKDVNDTNLQIEKENIYIDQEKFKYPLSAGKVLQMFRNAQDNGFTSYAEA